MNLNGRLERLEKHSKATDKKHTVRYLRPGEMPEPLDKPLDQDHGVRYIVENRPGKD